MLAENPRVVRIEAPIGSPLGEAMNAIRSWLDSHKIQPAAFKVLPAVGFEIAFRQEDEAGRFREQFGGQSE